MVGFMHGRSGGSRNHLGRVLLLLLVAVIFLLSTAGGAGAIEINRVTPAPGAVVEEEKPTVYIYFTLAKKEELNPGKLKVFLNDKDVSWKCLSLPQSVSLEPSFRFPEGTNTIRVLYDRGEGDPLRYEWSFTIKTKETVKSGLTHNAADTLFEGDMLEVSLKAEPGGKASFSIGSLKQGIAMEEESTGLYKGKYRVSRDDTLKNEKITARFTSREGSATDYEAEKPVKIAGYFFKVRIMKPLNDSKVDSYFDIEGKTRPGAKVSIAPQTGFMGSFGTNVPSGAQGAIEVMADENGFFKLHYGFPIKLPGTQHRFIVSAWDKDGNRSIPYVFSVKVK
ncbi:MAG: hypothetical protein RDV48_26945 [Candidatus Eremiobacteraeota bacterium]|nr:hypothetical protein [Candidatus Eremiobacteraeota bacterium]